MHNWRPGRRSNWQRAPALGSTSWPSVARSPKPSSNSTQRPRRGVKPSDARLKRYWMNRSGRSRRRAAPTGAVSHLKFGERRDEAIVHLAEDIGADLIVIGSREHGGLRRALMGGVADSVVRHAHCPVLVVRPQNGTDSSPSWRWFSTSRSAGGV